MEAKILDFNWLFVGNNAIEFITALADTENDDIFATTQIRVLVDFMWETYYTYIFRSLFMPFIFYFASFVIFATYTTPHLALNYTDENGEVQSLMFNFIVQIICIVTFAVTWCIFARLEFRQIKESGFEYFYEFWNVLDITQLAINLAFIVCKIHATVETHVLNILGSFALLLLYTKFFYWMRLFKPFSAFIRTISQIVNDIGVFCVMLLLCLMAFANIIILLQHNRSGNPDMDETPIFDPFVAIMPVDALLHAYLTGLGDFNKDNYSEEDAVVVWMMFFFATILVQLVFMNMLIAIMGESFGRITAIQE